MNRLTQGLLLLLTWLLWAIDPLELYSSTCLTLQSINLYRGWLVELVNLAIYSIALWVAIALAIRLIKRIKRLIRLNQLKQS